MFQPSLYSNPRGGLPLGQTLLRALKSQSTCDRTAEAASDPWGALLAGNADDAERDRNTFGGTENDEEKRDGVRQVTVS